MLSWHWRMHGDKDNEARCMMVAYRVYTVESNVDRQRSIGIYGGLTTMFA